MKLLKNSITTVLFSVLILGLSSNVEAQDKRSAIKTYNKALELAQEEDYTQAINVFNQALTQVEQLGEEGEDILQRIKGKLPQVHYQLALQKYKDFRNDQSMAKLDAAITEFRTAKEVGDRYNDSQISQKANSVITKLMYSKSLLYYQQKKNKKALDVLNKINELAPNYAKAYYQKGVVMKKVEGKSLEDAIAQFDKAIEIANQTRDNTTADRAKKSARDQLVYQGSKDIENENYDRAIELLQKALTYDETAENAYFRLAEAYNKVQEWQKAIDNARKGIEYESGGKTEKAKIYFELGTAYQGLGEKNNACSAFGNAAYGSFKSPAEHQMEYELKCDSATN